MEKAWVISAYINKSETVSLNTKDKKTRGYISYDLSRKDNIANNASNVNNTDTKFSLDVDRPYIVSFVANKHTNEIQLIVYYML